MKIVDNNIETNKASTSSRSNGKPCPACQFLLTKEHVDSSGAYIECPNCKKRYHLKKKQVENSPKIDVHTTLPQDQNQVIDSHETNNPSQKLVKDASDEDTVIGEEEAERIKKETRRRKAALTRAVNNSHDSEENIYKMTKEIPGKKYVVLDTETTGTNEDKDVVLSLSIVDPDGNVLFDHLIRPEKRKTWKGASEIHGIYWKDVKDEKLLTDYVEEIEGIFSQVDMLVGYNISFDLFILQNSGLRWPKMETFDLMKAHAEAHGKWSDYFCDYKWKSLSQCARTYGYDFPAHSSLEDAKATAFCMKQYMEESKRIYEKRGDEYWNNWLAEKERKKKEDEERHKQWEKQRAKEEAERQAKREALANSSDNKSSATTQGFWLQAPSSSATYRSSNNDNTQNNTDIIASSQESKRDLSWVKWAIGTIIAIVLILVFIANSCVSHTPPSKPISSNSNVNASANVNVSELIDKTFHTATINSIEGSYNGVSAVIVINGTLENTYDEEWYAHPTYDVIDNAGNLMGPVAVEKDIKVSKKSQSFTISFFLSREDLERFSYMRPAARFAAVNCQPNESDTKTLCQQARQQALDAWNAAIAPAPATPTESVVTTAPVAASGTLEEQLTSYIPNVRGADWVNWNEGVAPNYVLELGVADVGEIPPIGTITYGRLDHLGRTTAAAGNITKALRDAGSANGHDDFAAGDDPSGWPSSNPKVTISAPHGKTYNGYLWNRSHLIADSLGGQAIKRNAVTGTRMQNVGANDGNDAGGMAYCETRARNWLDSHPDGNLYYRATPMYLGDELIPRCVVVDMLSSDGTINMMVLVYNAAKDIGLDYSGSGSSASGGGSAPGDATPQPTAPAVVEQQPAAQGQTVWVAKLDSGHKYHSRSDCAPLKNADNVQSVSIDTARAYGMEPCSKCW